MSLRVRLLLLIGVALTVLWGAGAFWMQSDLEKRMRDALDQRLEMAATMVADLVAQNPAAWRQPLAVDKPLAMPASESNMECQIASVRGEVYAHSRGANGKPMAGVMPGFGDRVIEGHPWRTFTLEAHVLRITTSDRLSARSVLMQQVLLAAVVPFAVALVGGLLVLWLGVGSGLRPLERLRQALAARAPDALTPLSEHDIPRDLMPFVRTLNEMLERINTTLSRERRFTSDAAHELRTPLTAIKVHLDVLRLSRGEDARTALDHVDEGVARLQGALVQLLTLAQVEGQPSWQEQGGANASEVATLALRDAAPHGDRRMTLTELAAGAVLAVPQALAVTAVRNLLDNARRHAPANGFVELEVVAAGGFVSFTVRDDGPGMSEADILLATERFWRRGSGAGSGLGLSIVQAIADRFNGSFSLARREPRGLVAVLRLPV